LVALKPAAFRPLPAPQGYSLQCQKSTKLLQTRYYKNNRYNYIEFIPILTSLSLKKGIKIFFSLDFFFVQLLKSALSMQSPVLIFLFFKARSFDFTENLSYIKPVFHKFSLPL